MPLSERVVGLDELAAALGRKPEYIIRNWLKMHRVMGMPRKNPCGWVWPRGAMETWLERPDDWRFNGKAQVQPAPSDLVANQNKKLGEKYAGRSA